ncbi:MAG: bifunctional phosphoribosylaminoimidazolecarboxamide formyltransferase/IMP cyclohydrolase [Coriobacteriales bacterium]|nr:bifunctional phosphoribosylaminoimidazolecarboxamide formyltransferase/IMP cyclohydrolase [Coriobacteriales bacterium]
MKEVKVKRAIISVTDKTGVVDFARVLQDDFNVEIISTGGTAKALTDGGVKVIAIDDFTGFKEMMDGRVKTLHPKVHGGLLARRDLDSHMKDALDNDISLIDMVVVNLYAFKDTIMKEGVEYQDAIEHIDIGGPSMLRSAAKNHDSVCVVCDPADYDDVLDQMRNSDGCTSFELRQKCALKAFQTTSAYDTQIFTWFSDQMCDNSNFAQDKRIVLNKKDTLRYGENPHQNASVYYYEDFNRLLNDKEYVKSTVVGAKQIQGKELSYNNYLDTDSAWAAVREFGTETPSCVIIKHLTPCGIAIGDSPLQAYKDAFACDPVSAFGGVMAFNKKVTVDIAREIVEVNKQFIEVIIAPSYEDGALEIFATKPNARILETGKVTAAGQGLEIRSVDGGFVVQNLDCVNEDFSSFECATKVQPTDDQREAMLFAWKCVKSIKSNAVIITDKTKTLGIGGGQPNRVNSAKLAVAQAGDKAKGAVAASDAFLPFADTLEVLRDAGVTCLIQPGGSIRDDQTVDCANEAGIAMLYTGHRHFRH